MQRLDFKEGQETFREDVVTPSCDTGPQVRTTTFVSLEAEVPEVLFKEMKEFLGSNPSWDQYSLLSSALASFLFQNGCRDIAVAERYLNDLFSRTGS